MNTPAKTPSPDDQHESLIEIFRAGRHVDMNGREMEFTEAHLSDIAAGYDPAVSEAPIVIGHPSLNAPAYGWFKKLVAKGKTLFAEPHQVDPAFAALHNEGKFKKRSPSFLMPDAPNNPTPGKFYLRHVGFLGAAAPAVKGLKDYTFADGGNGVVQFADDKIRWGFGALADLFRGLRDRMIETDGLDKANTVIPDWQIEQLREASEPDAADDAAIPSYAETIEDPMNDPKKAEDLAARESALAAREKKLAEDEQAKRRDGYVAYADGLVKSGRLLPRLKPGIVELLLALPADASPLSFADGDKTVQKSAETIVRELLDGLPTQVNFAEKSDDRTDRDAAVEFSAPIGTEVDAAKAELLAKTNRYRAANPTVSFADAYRAVGGT